MKYRKFGTLDWEASIIGFGCMRFPTGENNGDILEQESREMLYYAIDQGVNYLDTAYTYHDGQSERFLGHALKNGYREKVRIATKLPAHMVERRTDFDRFLNEQLAKLQSEHIEFYLLHGLTQKTWHHVRDLGVIEWAEGAITDGRIGHLGFSFHDSYDVFQQIVDVYEWIFCMIQLNYLCEQFQAGTEGLRYAAANGLAVVIMEPIMGGGLANQPKLIQDLWGAARQNRSPAEWALQWVWNFPETTAVLSGMSTMEQIEENIESADRSGANNLSEEEISLIHKVRDKYSDLQLIACTKCGYCMPCPHNVDIPRNLEIYNHCRLFDQIETSLWQYEDLPEKNRASACEQCLECEEACPQNIEISNWLSYIQNELGKKTAK